MYFFIVFQPLDFTGQTEASHSKCASVLEDVERLNIAIVLETMLFSYGILFSGRNPVEYVLQEYDTAMLNVATDWWERQLGKLMGLNGPHGS